MTAPRPNIVFLMCDDRRFDTIGALGNRDIHTPNTDWLVEHGTAFTTAINPGGTSSAVCMPSRAMMHTGRSLFHIQGAGEEIAPSHTALGEAFRTAGYATLGIGKWHNGTESFNRSFSSGAEIFFGGMANHWNVPFYDYDPSGRYDARCLIVDDPFTSNRTRSRPCDHIHAGKHSTDIIGDAGLAFLRDHPTEQPYLLYLSFLAPHDPRTMPERYRDRYDPATIALPPNFLPSHPFDNGELDVRDEQLAAHPRTPEEIRRHIAEYYAMITHMDEQFGRVIDVVRQRGELDNTVFVHCADHGLALGQHGLMGKQNLYDSSTRVPLVMCGPGVPEGVRATGQACLYDVFPTLCELAGLPTPPSLEGRSLVPAFSHDDGRGEVFLTFKDLQRAVRTDRWKLIEYAPGSGPPITQLFDLHADPWEMTNLASDAAHAKTLRDLRVALTRLQRDHDDPIREPSP